MPATEHQADAGCPRRQCLRVSGHPWRVDAIGITADVVADPATTAPITRDADDDYLVALAREHEADYVVTGDRDLLEWDEQRPPVLSPAQFEALLAQ